MQTLRSLRPDILTLRSLIFFQREFPIAHTCRTPAVLLHTYYYTPTPTPRLPSVPIDRLEVSPSRHGGETDGRGERPATAEPRLERGRYVLVVFPSSALLARKRAILGRRDATRSRRGASYPHWG